MGLRDTLWLIWTGHHSDAAVIAVVDTEAAATEAVARINAIEPDHAHAEHFVVGQGPVMHGHYTVTRAYDTTTQRPLEAAPAWYTRSFAAVQIGAQGECCATRLSHEWARGRTVLRIAATARTTTEAEIACDVYFAAWCSGQPLS